MKNYLRILETSKFASANNCISKQIGNSILTAQQVGKHTIQTTIQRANGSRLVGEYVRPCRGESFKLIKGLLQNKNGSYIQFRNSRSELQTTIGLVDDILAPSVTCYSNGIKNYFIGCTPKLQFSENTSFNLFNKWLQKVLGDFCGGTVKYEFPQNFSLDSLNTFLETLLKRV